jgi:hypothetical protein
MIFTLLCARRASCNPDHEYLIDTGELLKRNRARDAENPASTPDCLGAKPVAVAHHIHPDMIARMGAILRTR